DADARIVDQHVERAAEIVEHEPPGLLARHVVDEEARAAAAREDGGAGLAAAVAVDVGDGDLGPLAGERERRSAPDAAGPAGHERDPALQARHHGLQCARTNSTMASIARSPSGSSDANMCQTWIMPSQTSIALSAPHAAAWACSAMASSSSTSSLPTWMRS